MTDVLVAGIAVADFVMQVDDLPAAAEKYRASEAMVTVVAVLLIPPLPWRVKADGHGW